MPATVSPLATRRMTWISRLGALALLLVAATGAMAWLVSLSPLRLERWRAIETSHNVTFDEAGTYVLFEEGSDADTRRGDPQVVVSVRSIAGRAVPIRPLIDERGRSTVTYDVRLHEGRAIAAVDIDRPGRYIVVSFPSSAISEGERRGGGPATSLARLPGLALGRDGEPSSLGGWGGLALLAGLPAVLGAAVAFVARRSFPVPLGTALTRRSSPV